MKEKFALCQKHAAAAFADTREKAFANHRTVLDAAHAKRREMDKLRSKRLGCRDTKCYATDAKGNVTVVKPSRLTARPEYFS